MGEERNMGTFINPDVRNDSGTMINPDSDSYSGTAINPNLGSGTVVSDLRLSEGYVVQGQSGEYAIRQKMDKTSGEADLYIAEHEGKEYVVKLYRRENSIKEGIVQKLLATNHPNLPKLYEVGSLGQNRFEIMEYYSQGSLENTTLSEQELRERFIPDMNEALKELDRLGIVHKDIKPPNIARKSDGHYVLMDFGISSVREDGQSIIVTQTGFTPDYCAPETSGALAVWSNLADYYSLGISIYQLYLGRLPNDGMTQEEKLRSATLRVLPVPDSVPADLKLLIRGLTYHDIRHRDERNNVNKRWAYEQVSDWLAGKEMIEPGSGGALQEKTGGMTPFEFGDGVYTDIDELMEAMAEDWEEGKKYIFRGLCFDRFKNAGLNRLASACQDVIDVGTDEAYCKFLYSGSYELDKIYWKGNAWYPEELGQAILKKLRLCRDVYDTKAMQDFTTEIELAGAHAISGYYASKAKGSQKDESDTEMSRKMNTAENEISRLAGSNDAEGFFSAMYRFVYTLTEKPILDFMGKFYDSYDDFMEDFEKHMMTEESEDDLKKYLEKIVTNVDGSGEPVLELQFANWIPAVNSRSKTV